MKKILLLGLLLLSGCREPVPTHSRFKLKQGEHLQLRFSQPVEGVRYLSASADEINWFSLEPDWFIIDYKNDPGTYYINNDYIVSWGIER